MTAGIAKRIARPLLVLLGFGACYLLVAQENLPDESPATPFDAIERLMTVDRLGALIRNVDENAVQSSNSWVLTVAGLETIVVYDIDADRMRIMIPVGPAEAIALEELIRLMQANFDSALDARYAIAQGALWSVFIHPLSTLTDEEFLVGLGQTANVVLSYGTSYSSGVFIFGSGDSAEIERQRLIEELKKKTTT
ncbi:MAG: type III secretion system chaperone [Actinomycetota bacterium]